MSFFGPPCTLCGQFFCVPSLALQALFLVYIQHIFLFWYIVLLLSLYYYSVRLFEFLNTLCDCFSRLSSLALQLKSSVSCKNNHYCRYKQSLRLYPQVPRVSWPDSPDVSGVPTSKEYHSQNEVVSKVGFFGHPLHFSTIQFPAPQQAR